MVALRHWRQLMLNPKGVKIWRPRQLYVGEGERDYVNMETRKEVDPTPASSPTEVRYRNAYCARIFVESELSIRCVHSTIGTSSILETSFPCRIQE